MSAYGRQPIKRASRAASGGASGRRRAARSVFVGPGHVEPRAAVERGQPDAALDGDQPGGTDVPQRQAAGLDERVKAAVGQVGDGSAALPMLRDTRMARPIAIAAARPAAARQRQRHDAIEQLLFARMADGHAVELRAHARLRGEHLVARGVVDDTDHRPAADRQARR